MIPIEHCISFSDSRYFVSKSTRPEKCRILSGCSLFAKVPDYKGLNRNLVCFLHMTGASLVDKHPEFVKAFIFLLF